MALRDTGATYSIPVVDGDSLACSLELAYGGHNLALELAWLGFRTHRLLPRETGNSGLRSILA